MDEKTETGDAASKLGSSSVLENPVNSEPADWDDRIACQLEELLLSNLHTIFRNAMKRIIDCGYEEAVARKAILRCGGLYQRGKDLASNILNGALASLKKGKGGDISIDMFEDLQQLVEYAMVEMVSVLRVVEPSLSVAEAMWRLLLFDLNIFMACEMKGDIFCNVGCKEVLEGSSSGSSPQLRSESQNPETILPSPNGPNVSKLAHPCSENYLPEILKFGSFTNLTNPKHPVAYEALTSGKDSLVPMDASRDYIPAVSIPEGKPATGRNRRSKELAALRKKSFNMEECKVACPTCAFRAGKLATVGGLVVERRLKCPSQLSAMHMKNASPKTKLITKAGGLVDESHHFLTNSLPGLNVADNSSILSMNGAKYAVPIANKHVPLSEGRTSKSSKTRDHGPERKHAPEAEGITSISSLSTDYFAGIPYDKSLGKYIPQDEKDKQIFKLVPVLQELQNELHSWSQWTNQKVKQAVHRLGKAQDEIKSLRQEKEEAELLKRKKKIMEEKRLSKMEFALNNTTKQLEDADCRLQKLEVEHSALKTEMEIANFQAATSASTFRKAFEIEQKAFKDVRSRDAQRSLLQKELVSERRKAAELQRKVGKANRIYNDTQMLWRQERMTMENFHAQAASIRKERESLEAAAKIGEDKIKLEAEKEMQKYEEEVKKLKDKLSELKMKPGSSKIVGFWRGTDGANGQCSSVNERNEIAVSTKGVVDINDYSGSRRLKQERECIMCLSEEKIVVFLPCAHQVLCVNCNELHHRQGMKYCPACRSPITRRICVRFAEPFARL